MLDLMWAGMDAVGVDVAPTRTDWSAAAFYFIAWLLLSTFCLLNLFVGAITDKYAEMQRGL